jgi:hypothetical protein
MPDDGGERARERIIREARAEIQVLVRAGLGARDVERRLFDGRIPVTEAERKVIRLLVRHELARAEWAAEVRQHPLVDSA